MYILSKLSFDLLKKCDISDALGLSCWSRFLIVNFFKWWNIDIALKQNSNEILLNYVKVNDLWYSVFTQILMNVNTK